jgi:hypothetical protein
LSVTGTVLRWFGYDINPESSIYPQTLRKDRRQEMVEVEMKSSWRVRGIPSNGPVGKDDGINEMYISPARR